MTELYEKLAEILEVETVAPESVLRDFETWDSLSALSILALADATYGVPMTAAELKQIRTAGELAGFLKAKRTK
jgi:acyl carrier protein